MVCCLTTQSHYLNQCWLIISEDLRHLLKGSFTWNCQDNDKSLKSITLIVCPHLTRANELSFEVVKQSLTQEYHVWFWQWFYTIFEDHISGLLCSAMAIWLFKLAHSQFIPTTSNTCWQWYATTWTYQHVLPHTLLGHVRCFCSSGYCRWLWNT